MFADANNCQKFLFIGGIAINIIYWSLLVHYWSLLFNKKYCSIKNTVQIKKYCSNKKTVHTQPTSNIAIHVQKCLCG